MNSPVVNIQRVENLHIGAGASPEIMGEVARGVSPEALRDIGHDVPEGTESSVATLSATPIEEDLERLESLEKQDGQVAVNANSRRNYLIKLVGEVGQQRKMEGFAVNHDRTPSSRGKVESKNYDMQSKAKETLGRACGVCALASTCEIRDNLGAWINTHPYANSDRPRKYGSVRDPKVKRTESRMRFLKRLDKDPLADCVPPKPKK